MKISNVEAYIISSPLEEPFSFAQGTVDNRSSVLVKIDTDEGITGWGESLCHGLQPPEIAASFVKHCFSSMLLGRSVFDIEVLWEEMYNRTRPFGQSGAALNAMSGVDIALWDALGKYLCQPIYNLIGGSFRKEVTPYVTGFYRKSKNDFLSNSCTEAKHYINKGFSAMKLKTGFGVDEDIQYLRSMRETVGYDIKLMADFNCAYNSAQARRLLYELEDIKIHFFEELLAPEDLEGYLFIRNCSSSYIAAGENIFGKTGYRNWICKGALDILQPDVCSCGGITEIKKIAAMAQSFNTMIIPHVWGSGVGLAASLQVIASLPPTPLSMNAEAPMLEYDQSNHPFRMELINNSIITENGKVRVPTGPGLGIEINVNTIEKYRVL